MKASIVLHTQDLSIGYQSKKANNIISKDINISLSKGKLIGLVGANGIGKSTLLRTLTGVQNPLDGNIFINSENITTINPLLLAKQLAVVFTDKNISKNLTVKEVVALGRFPYTNWIGTLTKKDKNIVNNALEKTHTQGLAEKKCYELSDGQLQKVMIARALAQDTDIIVLDEPTTHLDMYHKAYILKLLQKLTKETNKTILFSSHEIDLAIQLCDELIVMTNGNVLQNSPTEFLKNGTFNTLFPKDLIVFDENSGSFRVKK